MAMAMGIKDMVVMVLAILVFLVGQMATTDAAGVNTISTTTEEIPGWKSGRSSSTPEDSSVAEFLDEPSRRILATAVTYISYGALSGNRTPCPSAGRSYYNSCTSTGTVSPYRRSCVQITRCARG